MSVVSLPSARREPAEPGRDDRQVWGWDSLPAEQWQPTLLFLLGVATGLPVPGTSVFLGEVVFLFLLPVMALAWRWDRITRVGVLAISAWFVAELVTDLARHTGRHDTIFGLANIGFSAVDFIAFLTLMNRNKANAVALAASLPVSSFLAAYLFAPTLVAVAPWKLGFGGPVTLVVGLLAGLLFRRGARVPAAGALAAIGLLDIVLNARSLGGFAIVAAVLVVFPRRAIVNRQRALLISATLLVVGIATVFAYSTAASGGLLGPDQQTKAENNSGDYGPLLGDRKELFFEAHAIRESPLFGYGSHPNMSRDEKTAVVKHITSLNYDFTPSDASQYLVDDTLPRHSSIVDAWVTGGPLGLLPWVLAIGVIVGWLRRPPPAALAQLYPTMCLLVVTVAWSIVFSPFAAGQRPVTTFTIALLCTSGLMADKHHAPETTDEPVSDRPSRRARANRPSSGGAASP